MKYPDYPPKTSESESEKINNTILDWSLGNGLVMLSPHGETGTAKFGSAAVHAPVTVYPSPFPKSGFQHALNVQKNFNLLYANISNDVDWLSSALKE